MFKMRKILLSVLAVASMVSCNTTGENEFVINGDAAGINDGTNVYLQKQDSLGGLVQLDTVKVEKGKFKFEGAIVDPSFHFIQFESKPGEQLGFIMEEGAIDITVNKDTIVKSKVTGTPSNDQLAVYYKDAEKIQKKVLDFRTANQEKMAQAQASQDTVVSNALMKEYNVLQQETQKEFMDVAVKNIEKNPKSYFSFLLLRQLMFQPERDMAKIEGYYNKLDEKIKATSEAKKFKKSLDEASALEKKKAVVPQQ